MYSISKTTLIFIIIYEMTLLKAPTRGDLSFLVVCVLFFLFIMARITDKRVVVATLFLPYTVDFELQDKKKRNIFVNTVDSPATTPATLNEPANTSPPSTAAPNLVPNLIQTLAKHQQQKKEDVQHHTENLFDFTRPEQLIQPRSKQQREEEIRKLTPLLSVIPTQSRRPSIDTAQVFADAPWSVKPSTIGNIGLNNALFSIQHLLHEVAWVGTLGMSTESLSQKTEDEIETTFKEKYQSYPVMPSDNVFDGHYNQYCKQVKEFTLFFFIGNDN